MTDRRVLFGLAVIAAPRGIKYLSDQSRQPLPGGLQFLAVAFTPSVIALYALAWIAAIACLAAGGLWRSRTQFSYLPTFLMCGLSAVFYLVAWLGSIWGALRGGHGAPPISDDWFNACTYAGLALIIRARLFNRTKDAE